LGIEAIAIIAIGAIEAVIGFVRASVRRRGVSDRQPQDRQARVVAPPT
jgi:hypothetical protein